MIAKENKHGKSVYSFRFVRKLCSNVNSSNMRLAALVKITPSHSNMSFFLPTEKWFMV